MILQGHPDGGLELIVLFVDVLGHKIVGHCIRPVEDRFRQGTEERIGASADHHADHFVSLFQAPRVGVADKMAVADDLFHLFACSLVNVRPVIQDAADRGDGNPGHFGDVPDRIDFHGCITSVFADFRKR